MSTAESRYAIFAGYGLLPRLVYQTLHTQGTPVRVITFSGQPALENMPVDATFPIGKVAQVVTYMKSEGITHVVMAGGLKKPSLLSLRPDFVALKLLFKAGLSLKHDDFLLRMLTTFLGEHGIEVVPVQSIVSGLFVDVGSLTQTLPSQNQLQLIQAGIEALDMRSEHDLGQSVLVRADGALIHEGQEGTAALIADNAAEVLVKGTKIGQTMKADVPTVGIQTIDALVKGSYKGLAIEAGKTFMLEQEDCIRMADAHNLFIYAWSRDV